MITLNSEREVRHAVAKWRAEGARIGFVPTMGALHAGHLSLLRIARQHASRVVVSIFVNPTQFGPDEDLDKYPRTPEKDAAALAAEGCDLLFLPDVETIYPPGATTRVRVDGPSQGLEGECRPGHFEGVATVVALLFGIVRPDVAVFGEKDAQQLAVVRALVRDLHLGVEILPGPIVREPDGLAMSSRNVFLAPDERRAATVLHRAREVARAHVEAGERRSAPWRKSRRCASSTPRPSRPTLFVPSNTCRGMSSCRSPRASARPACSTTSVSVSTEGANAPCAAR
jgi:pantoate--beta-alanine ligase